MSTYVTEEATMFDSFSQYLMAFLFTQMGNALQYKNILDEIKEDEENQYYTDIAYQYGRLTRKILDVEPMSTSSYSLSAAKADQTSSGIWDNF